MYRLFRLLFNPQLTKYVSEEFIENIKQKIEKEIDKLSDSFTFDKMDDNQ